MTYAPENFRLRYTRVQKTLAAWCIAEYDDNLTAAVMRVTSMLAVTVAGTLAVSVLALLLCLLYAGLAMTAFIANIVRSPAVQRALRRRLPVAAVTVDAKIASRIALDCARLATATLVFSIWFVAQSVGIGMLMAVEFIGPSSRPDEQTPLKPAAGGPIYVVDTTAELPDSAKNPESVSTENGTPLPVGSVETPFHMEAASTPNGTSPCVKTPSSAEAVSTENGTPLPVGSVETPFHMEAASTPNGTPLPVDSVETPFHMEAASTPNGTPLPVGSVETPNGTPLPVGSVETPFHMEAASTPNGTPLPVGSVETPFHMEAASTPNGTPLPLGNVKEASAVRVDTTPSTYKYWKKRHALFSKFDQGILMDEESFYSVCPETLSVYMAEKCGRVKVAVDPFCGAGGNIIQLARLFDKVIAVDIDPDKIVMAKENAAIYGVLEKIEFVVGDFFKLANHIKGDVMVTSPPWGGPEYNKMGVIGPLALSMDKILEVGKTIAPKILLHLPKNLDKTECWKMCNGIGASLGKIENVFIDKYLNSMLLYVRSNNNNSVPDVAPKLVDIHLHNSFRKNERYHLKTYQSYLVDVDTLVRSRRASV